MFHNHISMSNQEILITHRGVTAYDHSSCSKRVWSSFQLYYPLSYEIAFVCISVVLSRRQYPDLSLGNISIGVCILGVGVLVYTRWSSLINSQLGVISTGILAC